MNLTSAKVTEIFYLIDEFCIQFEVSTASHRLGNVPKRSPRLSQSEVITMMTLFHYGSFRNMKHFYLNYVQKHLQAEFPKTVSYNRFVELMQSAVFPMTLFLKTCCMGECTGISMWIPHLSGFARTSGLNGTKCLRTRLLWGNQQWDGSLGLNCT